MKAIKIFFFRWSKVNKNLVQEIHTYSCLSGEIIEKINETNLWLWICHQRQSLDGTIIHGWAVRQMPVPVIKQMDQQMAAMAVSSMHPIWVHFIHWKMPATEDIIQQAMVRMVSAKCKFPMTKTKWRHKNISHNFIFFSQSKLINETRSTICNEDAKKKADGNERRIPLKIWPPWDCDDCHSMTYQRINQRKRRKKKYTKINDIFCGVSFACVLLVIKSHLIGTQIHCPDRLLTTKHDHKINSIMHYQ